MKSQSKRILQSRSVSGGTLARLRCLRGLARILAARFKRRLVWRARGIGQAELFLSCLCGTGQLSLAAIGVDFIRRTIMADKKIIAVVGATGAQGGGLVRAILATRARLRRPRAHPDVRLRKAKELAKLGAEVVAADLDDPRA